MSDEDDPFEGMTDADRETWRGITTYVEQYVAKVRQEADDLRGAATFRPREAAKLQLMARRLDRMADAAERSLE
jgi:hypothetical protein